MKKLLTIIGLVACLTSVNIKAQTVTNNQNIFVSALESTIVDTNSTFWNAEKFEIRATTQTTFNKYESVLGCSYSIGTSGFGVGAEIINGAVNTIDSAYGTVEYGIKYYNIKLTGYAGLGYDNVNQAFGGEIGGRLSVAVSKNMFLIPAEVLWQWNTHSITGPNQQTSLRVGAGFKF